MRQKTANAIPTVVILAIIQAVPAVIKAIGGLFSGKKKRNP
jgi:hypothetical protein